MESPTGYFFSPKKLSMVYCAPFSPLRLMVTLGLSLLVCLPMFPCCSGQSLSDSEGLTAEVSPFLLAGKSFQINAKSWKWLQRTVCDCYQIRLPCIWIFWIFFVIAGLFCTPFLILKILLNQILYAKKAWCTVISLMSLMNAIFFLNLSVVLFINSNTLVIGTLFSMTHTWNPPVLMTHLPCQQQQLGRRNCNKYQPNSPPNGQEIVLKLGIFTVPWSRNYWKLQNAIHIILFFILRELITAANQPFQPLLQASVNDCQTEPFF